MSNLFEFTNRFRIYDVEGVVLDNPNDFILVREPINFADTTITLERDVKTHGFNYEFSDAETPFGFHRVKIEGEDYSGYTLLLDVFNKSGVDGRCILEFSNLNKATDIWEVQYQADLDFESFMQLDSRIEMSARRINLDDLFRTRRETEVSLSATESIDGSPITGITPESMFLHSKTIRQDAVFSNGGFSWFFSDTDFTQTRIKGTPYNLLLDYDSITFENGDKPSIEIEEVSYVSAGFPDNTYLVPRSRFVLNIPEGIGYNAIFTIVVQGTLTSDNSNQAALEGGILLNAVGDFPIPLFNDVVTNGSIVIDREETHEISIDSDTPDLDEVLFFLKGSDTDDSGHNFQATKIEFKMSIDSINQNSYSEVYKGFDVITHTLEVINNSTNLLVSDFWQNVADDIYFTNGYKIRSLSERSVFTNFEELFDKWAQPMFGLGYAVVEIAGEFKVVMERYDHFYQDVEVDYFDSIENGSWEVVVDKDIIFNEIEVGYKEFPKSTDENKNNNIDEFNTVQSLLTPIKTVKKKKEYVSDVIGSGYKLESQRRQQYKEIPADTVSDDDKNFVIKGRQTQTYTVSMDGDSADSVADSTDNTLTISGTWYSIQENDNITISGWTGIDGVYSVVSFDLTPEQTILYVDNVPINSIRSSGTISLTLPEARLTAERNEAFDVLDDVIAPNTVYNAGLTPKNMLFNQSLLINSGFNPKIDTSEVTTQDFKLNGEMTSQFKVGEGGYVLDPDRQVVQQNEALTLSRINQNNKLFTGFLIKFTTSIGYGRLLNIRDACLSQSDSGNNYGYVRVKDPFGVDWLGWIMSVDYNPLSEKVDFVLRASFVPSGASFDYVLDNVMN